MITGEIVTTVCEKISMTDAQTRALVLKWTDLRHRMLCQRALFRDLLSLYTLTVPANSEEIILRRQIDHVLGAKYDLTNLLPTNQMFVFAADPGLWERSGRASRMVQLPAVATSSHPADEQLAIVSNNAADTTQLINIVGELDGYHMEETLTLNGTTPVISANSYDVVYNLSKEATAGMISITGQTSATTLGVIAAADTGHRYPRLRLLEKPQQQITLLVLGKRRPTPLRNNATATAWDGLDLALEAFVLADAYEWQRQHGDAADKRQEGMALLQQLLDTQVYQDASLSQLVPYDMSGPGEFPAEGGFSGKGVW